MPRSTQCQKCHALHDVQNATLYTMSKMPLSTQCPKCHSIQCPKCHSLHNVQNATLYTMSKMPHSTQCPKFHAVHNVQNIEHYESHLVQWTVLLSRQSVLLRSGLWHARKEACIGHWRKSSGFEVLTMVSDKDTVFWVVTSCSLVHIYWPLK